MEQILLEFVLRHMEDREMILDSQHHQGKSCQTKPVAPSVDKGRATGVIYLDSVNSLT